MKIGKVSQTILKRSMIKPLEFKREESLFEVTPEEMCYGVTIPENAQTLLTDVTLFGNEKDLGVYALAQGINHLATRGAKTIGVGIHIVLPPYAYESRLKTMVEHVENVGKTLGVQVLSVKADVSSAVSSAIVNLQLVGAVEKNCLRTTAMAKKNSDIVLLGQVGLEGTLRILEEKEEELGKRFVAAFLRGLREKRNQLFVQDILPEAQKYSVSAMHQITQGGILAGLWELGEAAQIGMEVSLRDMNICQETVEVCEHFQLNPYMLTSAGCILIVTDRGEELTEFLKGQGYKAGLIGRTTDRKERVILGGEEKRFLDRPAPDELIKIYDDHKEEL